MRPYVHVTMGATAANEVYYAKFEKDLHRSVTPGPSSVVTTASVVAYTGSGGSLDPAFPCIFEHNDFGPFPFSGLVQNSSGMTKFAGLGAGTGAIIIDP
jgi:hypothetical protein